MDVTAAATAEVSGSGTDIPGYDPGLGHIDGQCVRRDGDQILTEFEVEVIGGNERMHLNFIEDTGAAD